MWTITDPVTGHTTRDTSHDGRTCLICHGWWLDAHVLCPGCLKALSK